MEPPELIRAELALLEGKSDTASRLRRAALEQLRDRMKPDLAALAFPKVLTKRCPGPTHALEEDRHLPPKAFYVKLERKDGLSPWCKECHRDYARKHPSKYVPGSRRKAGGLPPRGLTALEVARKLARAAMDPDRVPRERRPLPPGYRRCKNPECRKEFIPPGSRGVAIPMKGRTMKYRIDFCEVCRTMPQFLKKKPTGRPRKERT